ncbi:MAG TPA: alpha/beta hydrolase [Methylomirabilota bacterium]|nr:alpha/beta hydrolase [Methylomirabilota bacterium]
MRRVGLSVGAFILLALASPLLAVGLEDPPDVEVPGAAPCIIGGDACLANLALGNGARLSYYRTFPLQPLPGTTYAGIKRAVIVIHGLSRNAPGYFSYVVQSAIVAGKLNETIVMAPYFRPAASDARVLYWKGDGWREGELSNDPGGGAPRMTSFHVIDVLLAMLNHQALFPDLDAIVIAGHSAGGQFTQRYAATSPAASYFAGSRFRFVVSNPSSYMYLGPERWISDRFRIPPLEVRLLCGGWDRYKYGLGGRDGYVGQLHASAIRQQYRVRDVIYLIGQADTGNAELDRGCEANLQGRHRYRRGVIFKDFMQTFYPGNGHRLLIVPGVGHDANQMFNSAPGRSALFGVP